MDASNYMLTEVETAQSGSASASSPQPHHAGAPARSKPILSVVVSNDAPQHHAAKTVLEAMGLPQSVSAPTVVVLVDADPKRRAACTKAIKREKTLRARVMTAETIADGAQIALRELVDCIVLVGAMPIGGEDALRSLLSTSAECAEFPIITVDARRPDSTASITPQTLRHHVCLDNDGWYLDLLPLSIQHAVSTYRAIHGKHHAEQLHRTLIEHIDAITYLAPVREHGGLSYVSPQIARLGFSEQQWLHHPNARFHAIHEEDRDAVMTAFAHSCRVGAAFCQDYRIVCANGDIRWVHDSASVVKNHAERPVYLQGVMVDITDMKQMENELNEYRRFNDAMVERRTASLQRRCDVMSYCNKALGDKIEWFHAENSKLERSINLYRVLLNSLGGAVVMMDCDALIVDMNQEAERLLKVNANEASGHKADEIVSFSMASVSSIWEMIEACRLGENLCMNRALLTRHGGEDQFVDTRMAPIMFGSNIAGYALMMVPTNALDWVVCSTPQEAIFVAMPGDDGVVADKRLM